MKILIVDDEKNIRLTLSNILEDEGHETYAVGTVKEGIDILEDYDPDTVLLDVKLPDGNGIEALEKIRKMLPTIPVIMISGNSSINNTIKTMPVQ